MIGFTLEIEDEDLDALVAQTEADLVRNVALIMERIGWETVAFLRETGHGTRPPVRPGEPSRSAHPGGWADVTSQLANAYRFELYAGGSRIRWSEPGEQLSLGGAFSAGNLRWPLELHFINGMEYAAALEARDGYWVVREVTEAGGPVRRALRHAIQKIDPSGSVEVL